MKIKAVYDNHGESLDRYSVVTDMPWNGDDQSGGYYCLCLSGDPDSPRGVSSWSCANLGPHLGQKISLEELPQNVQDHIARRMRED